MDQVDQKKEIQLSTRILDVLLRVGLLGGLFVWCVIILKPFLYAFVWGIIIAVALNPANEFLSRKLGNRRKLAAFLLVLLSLVVLAIPLWLFGDSLARGVEFLNGHISRDDLSIPPPNPDLKEITLIGPPIYDLWYSAHNNLSGLVSQYSAQIRDAGAWLISSIAELSIDILIFFGSLLMAGILMAYGHTTGKLAYRIGQRLAGEHGNEFTHLAELTIRNVVRGIIGVAFIQAAMAGLGFYFAGVPLSGLWALICLLLAIMQLGIGIVAIPVAIYTFMYADLTTAIILSIWLVITFFSDNILKPILLGKGAPVPMLVVFLGSIGGFISSGIIGLFLGAIVLSLGYKLITAWVGQQKETEKAEIG